MKVVINSILRLTSPNMSHEPRVPKSNCQELGSSMSDFLTLVPNYTFQKSDRKGPVVLTSVLKVVESNKS